MSANLHGQCAFYAEYRTPSKVLKTHCDRSRDITPSIRFELKAPGPDGAVLAKGYMCGNAPSNSLLDDHVCAKIVHWGSIVFGYAAADLILQYHEIGLEGQWRVW